VPTFELPVYVSDPDAHKADPALPEEHQPVHCSLIPQQNISSPFRPPLKHLIQTHRASFARIRRTRRGGHKELCDFQVHQSKDEQANNPKETNRCHIDDQAEEPELMG
jgi:hypothetical protein